MKQLITDPEISFWGRREPSLTLLGTVLRSTSSPMDSKLLQDQHHLGPSSPLPPPAPSPPDVILHIKTAAFEGFQTA